MQRVLAVTNLAQISQGVYYCQLLMSQLELMKASVDDLLDLEMLRSGHFNIQRSPFNVFDAVEHIYRIFAP